MWLEAARAGAVRQKCERPPVGSEPRKTMDSAAARPNLHGACREFDRADSTPRGALSLVHDHPCKRAHGSGDVRVQVLSVNDQAAAWHQVALERRAGFVESGVPRVSRFMPTQSQ